MPLSQCNTTLLEYNKNKNLAAVRIGISAYNPNGKIVVKAKAVNQFIFIGNDSAATRIVEIVSFSVRTCGAPMHFHFEFS